MVLLIGRRLFRLLVCLVITFFILPLLFFYITGQGRHVHFRQPCGKAIKVAGETLEEGNNYSVWGRIRYHIIDFYQNEL